MFLPVLVLFIIYVVFYNYKKNQLIYSNRLNKYETESSVRLSNCFGNLETESSVRLSNTPSHPYKKPLRILSYNVQRLPFLLRPNIDIHSWMEQYDIVCLQENYCSFTGGSKQSFGYNCIIPPSDYRYLVDSGLSIYSKNPLEYIGFYIFDTTADIDQLSNKGFLIIKIDDFYIVNTHLQSSYSYTHEENHKQIINSQLQQICDKCSEFKKVIIIGDFNTNIKKAQHIMIKNNYKCLCPHKPTYLGKRGLNDYYDGVFYKNKLPDTIQTEMKDPLTDHLAISFFVRCTLEDYNHE